MKSIKSIIIAIVFAVSAINVNAQDIISSLSLHIDSPFKDVSKVLNYVYNYEMFDYADVFGVVTYKFRGIYKSHLAEAKVHVRRDGVCWGSELIVFTNCLSDSERLYSELKERCNNQEEISKLTSKDLGMDGMAGGFSCKELSVRYSDDLVYVIIRQNVKYK